MDVRIADKGLWVHSKCSHILKEESVNKKLSKTIACLLIRAQLLWQDLGGSAREVRVVLESV